jgi:N-acetyl-1-D-myo-inositol-2-amino-2-deoxy-alpha-D-glucopyranoside deacetylase
VRPGRNLVCVHAHPDDLAELDRALELLGAGPARLLGYKDSGLPATGDPASFWRADIDDAVGRLVGQLRELRPDVLVAYDAAGIYGHPDHVQAHRVALLAAEASGSAALYPAAGPACASAPTPTPSAPPTSA